MQATSQPLTVSLRLPSATRERMEDVARRRDISMESFIALAIAEKLSRIEHEEWLAEQTFNAGGSCKGN